MFGTASSTAQESVLESRLTAQVYAGVSLLTAQLAKCEGVFSNPKGLVRFGMVVSPQHVPSSRKRRGNLFQEKLLNFSFRKLQHVVSGQRQKSRNPPMDQITVLLFVLRNIGINTDCE